MRKIGFTLSGVLVVIGVNTLLKTTIINLVMPKIGLAAFQCAMAGSYSPNNYHINFIFVDIVAIGLIVVGLILGYKFYRAEKQ